jgi:hypothetical protein
LTTYWLGRVYEKAFSDIIVGALPGLFALNSLDTRIDRLVGRPLLEELAIDAGISKF